MLDGEIEAFAGALMLEQGLSANTCKAYGSDLGFFAGYLKRIGIESAAAITREHIVGFLDEQRTLGHNARTRARREVAIKMFLRYLCARRMIPSDPSALMDAPKKGLVLPRVLSEEETRRMLDAVSGEEPRELRDRAMLEVFYGCGLRVSELCALDMGDLVGEGELLRILGKGSKERMVPLTAGAGAALAAYLDRARTSFLKGRLSENHVFVTRLGKPFTRQGVFKLIRERAVAVGIAPERVSPHVLRHSYASHLLEHGADIRVIQELLGHADIGTTQIYTHVDSSSFQDTHRRYHPRA